MAVLAAASSLEQVPFQKPERRHELSGAQKGEFAVDLKHLFRQIRSLTTKEPPVFEPEMKRLCAESGIAIAPVKELPKTRLSGSTFWLNGEKAVIILSLRYKRNDHFWFTFFHEAGHVLLHSKKGVIINGYSLSGSVQEDEANTFAADLLIPSKAYNSFIL
jgi:hypothetical protein